MALTTHPKCQKTFPGNNTHGHCSGCCETFVGLVTFDKHRRYLDNGERGCINPTEDERFWSDDRGYWHTGKPLTDAEKKRIWG